MTGFAGRAGLDGRRAVGFFRWALCYLSRAERAAADGGKRALAGDDSGNGRNIRAGMGTMRGKTRQTAAYGCWRSPLSAELIFGGRQTPGAPVPWRGGTLFLLNMPAEGNAAALMYADGAGRIDRVSPAGFNLRSKLHEYGGMPFAAGENAVFFCNFDDQEIYRQRLDPQTARFSPPEPITDSSGDQLRYADLIYDHRRDLLYCAREDHRAAGEAHNSLVAIELDDKQAPQAADDQRILFDATDFVAGPSLSADGAQLVFIAWSHPNMPWDETQIQCARLRPGGGIVECFQVDAESSAAKLQPGFDTAGNLYFLTDRSGYWNLARVAAADLRAGCRGAPVYPVAADCCGPPWQLGDRNYAVGADGGVFITVADQCRWHLREVSSAGEVRELAQDLGLLEQLRLDDAGRLSCLSAGDDDYPAVVRREPAAAPAAKTVFRAALPRGLSADYVSRPRHFEFRAPGGAVAYGLLYQPRNPEFQSAAGELPPLLVNVHGGPTGTARAALNPLHQFWTSRGFAVLDLNHRGSTGYGREFRQALDGKWGVVDIEDAIAAVRYLLDTEQVDSRKIAIRGGSAGGYVVLASLAACDLFAAGVSYYGVSDLELLARDTHKFESRYLDRLIGPWPEAAELYRRRSPINRLDKIAAPVLILQGSEDKVVPPSQSESLYARLKTRIPASEYIGFEGEGHGFRRPANQIRALEAELDFFRRNLRLA